MRFQLEHPLKEQDFGRRRIIERFLWFPRKVDYEVRWLENVMIEQKVTFIHVYDRDCGNVIKPTRKYIWQDSKWVDPPINLK